MYPGPDCYQQCLSVQEKNAIHNELYPLLPNWSKKKLGYVDIHSVNPVQTSPMSQALCPAPNKCMSPPSSTAPHLGPEDFQETS